MSVAPHSSQPAARRGAELVALSRAECLRLLGDRRFGRLAVNTGAGAPLLRPVNYRFDSKLQAVVFRTVAGSKFHALLRAAEAAFEVDQVDETQRTGWSVVVRGVTDEITDAGQTERLDRVGLETWAPGPASHWMQIRAWTVSGRRIVLPERMAAETYLG